MTNTQEQPHVKTKWIIWITWALFTLLSIIGCIFVHYVSDTVMSEVIQDFFVVTLFYFGTNQTQKWIYAWSGKKRESAAPTDDSSEEDIKQ